MATRDFLSGLRADTHALHQTVYDGRTVTPGELKHYLVRVLTLIDDCDPNVDTTVND